MTTTTDTTRYAGRHCRDDAGWTDRTDPDYEGRHRAPVAADLIDMLRTALARAT